MIKINVQSNDILTLNKQIADATNAIRAKSFTDRNPHLGKMINCVVCSHRHYSYKVCELRYATHDRHGDPYFEDGSPLVIDPKNADNPISMRNAIYGAAPFKRKRLRPHLSQKTLLILHRASEAFNEELEYLESTEDDDIETRELFDEIRQPDVTKHIRAAQIAVIGSVKEAERRLKQSKGR